MGNVNTSLKRGVNEIGGAQSPRLFSHVRYGLADAGAQETSIILNSYLAARQKVGDGCYHLSAATRAGTNCQNEIPERKSVTRSDDLPKLAITFHTLSVSVTSRCDARCHCEYVVHGYACSYSLLMHLRTDR